METDQLIAADTFCSYYQVEYSFVESMREMGLLEMVVVRETQFIQIPELQKIEKMLRLHDDLNINPEGISAVHTLLDQMEKMRMEIIMLKNKLRLYEERF